MNRIETAATEVRSALARLDAELISAGIGDGLEADADVWLAAADSVERTARLADALRLRVAGHLAGAVGERTAERLGRRSAVDLLAVATSTSERAARSRLRLGEAIASRRGLTGCELPPAFPAVGDAVRTGRLGAEAAGVIVRALSAVAGRADESEVTAAEDGLVHLGCGVAGQTGEPRVAPSTVDELRCQASAFAAYIDPDGARPREERMMRRRSLRFGAEDADGLISVHGRLATEVGLGLRRLVEAHRRARHRGFLEAVEDAGGPVAVQDERAPEQQRHDALAAIISAASRAVDAPQLGSAPPAVLVTVSSSDLDDPAGRAGDAIGRIEGAETLLSRRTVERLVDAGGVQPVRIEDGRIRALGSVQRCFTPTQRRALSARDGGCVIPGCAIPAGWCEAHHVIPDRDGGPTHTDNGVLLCWWHHRRIDTGPWSIRMASGVPHIRGPGHPTWTAASGRPRIPACARGERAG